MLQRGGGKLPGKTQYSGRRRTTTRRSGFKSHPDSTGADFKVEKIPSYPLNAGEQIDIEFTVPNKRMAISAFGGWFTAKGNVDVSVSGIDNSKITLSPASVPDWGKVGSMWVSESNDDSHITVSFIAKEKSKVAFYLMNCGIVTHRHLEWARIEKPVLLQNMYQFAPEANFISIEGKTTTVGSVKTNETFDLYIKSCNRCARFLPINIHNERLQLSFSNHCVAQGRRPCKHTGFGKLKDFDTGESISLEYGYQLECRFCKKYEVNAAHNPQRTSAQMKEDAARRRAFELLLTGLYAGSHQLEFRHRNNGVELSDYIWEKFNHRCFNCGTKITSAKTMHLDHTRPLALLWPLDGTATCLCGSCNSQKRDRSPVEFYSNEQIQVLSKITTIPIEELLAPSPNMEAIHLLLGGLDWFFGKFLLQPELTKERDGKVAAELLVKALQKTFNHIPGGSPVDLIKEYERRQKS